MGSGKYEIYDWGSLYSSTYDSIWVIVYQITKSANFLPVNTLNLAEDNYRLYLREFVKLHRFHLAIIFVGYYFTSQS